MSTLTDKLPKIMDHIKIQQQQQTIFEQKVMDIYSGQLQKYVEDSIKSEFQPTAANKAIERIAPINILPKVINKVSQVYTLGVTRMTGDNEIDSELLAFYELSLSLDSKMNTVNQLINLFRYCAIEPYIADGKPQIRILPPTQFTVYSDDFNNPLNPTVFIKYMGKTETTVPRTDSNGRAMAHAETVVLEVDLFYMYSDTEILIVDGTGTVRHDLIANIGNPEGINPLGVIPFIYVNAAEFDLIPLPRQDMFTMPILIPKLLTDMNYATKFQSHAIVYSIDLDASQVESNPDSMWNLKSDGTSDKPGQIGTIKPEVDVDKVLTLINSELTLWLESLGVKSSGMASIGVESASSGIAKAIDESDVANLRNDQKKIFKSIEADLWSLISVYHEHWLSNGKLQQLPAFSSDFSPSITYGELQPFIDPKARIEEVKLKYESGLTSFKRAVSEANPELSIAEIEELIQEMADEKQAQADQAAKMFQPLESEEETEEE